jgi:hypothetical protein
MYTTYIMYTIYIMYATYIMYASLYTLCIYYIHYVYYTPYTLGILCTPVRDTANDPASHGDSTNTKSSTSTAANGHTNRVRRICSRQRKRSTSTYSRYLSAIIRLICSPGQQSPPDSNQAASAWDIVYPLLVSHCS